MAKKIKMPRKNDPEIYDDLVYVLMDSSGRVEIPMSGWDVKRVACDYHTALCYGKDEEVSKLFARYSDQILYDIARSCGELDKNELKDREKCIAWILLLLACDLCEYEKPNMFIAVEKLQQK